MKPTWIVAGAMIVLSTIVASSQPLDEADTIADQASAVSDADLAELTVWAERQGELVSPWIDVAASQMPQALTTRRYDRDAERDAARVELLNWNAEFLRKVASVEAAVARDEIPDAAIRIARADPTFSLEAAQRIMDDRHATIGRLRAYQETVSEIVTAALNGQRDPHISSRAIMHLTFRDVATTMALTGVAVGEIDATPNSFPRSWGHIVASGSEADAIVHEVALQTLLGAEPPMFDGQRRRMAAVATRLLQEVEVMRASLQATQVDDHLSQQQKERMSAFIMTVLPQVSAYADAMAQWTAAWQAPTTEAVMDDQSALDVPTLADFIQLDALGAPP